MSMMERVARAICRVEEPDFDPGADDHGREPALWTNYIEHARAATAAMREPTDTMILAALDGTESDPAYGDIWRVMLDAALEEKNE